jgi:GTPase SAR1 family protein
MSGNHETQNQQTPLHDDLKRVRYAVERLHSDMTLKTDIDLDTFLSVLDTRLIIPLDPDYPLMVAVCGGGSTGKSSLFNALIQSHTSAVKSGSGWSRRVLAAIHPDILERPDFLNQLFERFGKAPEKLTSQDELLVPGDPRYVLSDKIPRNLIVMDTPDFDTGDGKNYINRELVRPVLHASDVLLYVFTVQTYNNLENTRFIRSMLTEIGKRKVVFVYRCSKKLPEADVNEHTLHLARIIYGDAYPGLLQGIYRVDEDDLVVTQEAFMKIRPASGYPDIHDLLAALDKTQTRTEFIHTALTDVCRDAHKTLSAAKKERLIAESYYIALRIKTSWAVAEALKSFPQKELLDEFLAIWEKLQPGYVKLLKQGKKLAIPIKYAAKTIKKWKSRKTEQVEKKQADPDLQFEVNLKRAATQLHQDIQGAEIKVETTDTDDQGHKLAEIIESLATMIENNDDEQNYPRVKKQASQTRDSFVVYAVKPHGMNGIHAEGGQLSEDTGLPWKDTLDGIKSRLMKHTGVSNEIHQQLVRIAQEKRNAMSGRDKFLEVLSAGLTAVPAIGAVTYVLMTGDAVIGAPNVYAALGGLFGLNDLFAVVSIPASEFANRVDRANLGSLLKKVFVAWYQDKKDLVEQTLIEYVSGDSLNVLKRRLDMTDSSIRDLEQALTGIEKVLNNESV